MRRRDFLGALGGAVAAVPWPLPAYAQQAMPVIGYLSGRTLGDSPHVLAAFRRGLAEAGFAEGQNVAIEFRWAETRYDRLPAMAAELTRLPVSVIAASGGNPAVDAAKAATNTIPVVFVTGGYPLREGLVTSLNRPGGNVTGTTFMAAILGTKQLELLRMMIPRMTTVAILARSNSPFSQRQLDELQAAVRSLGLQSIVVSIATADEIDEAFTEFARRKVDAFVAVGEPMFGEQSGRIATLAARHGMPGIFNIREFAAAGGLMSYGASLTDAYRQSGIYVGRILKGEWPAEIPVQQPTKFNLVLNLRTAKALGVTVPHTILALADEVIE
jgi:putative ABC transport system substrate-binding protein